MYWSRTRRSHIAAAISALSVANGYWFYDITGLKKAEEARQRSERRLVEAIESISEGFAYYDADDRMVLCNSCYREMLHSNVDADMAPGTSFETIIRNAAERGDIKDAEGQVEEWIPTACISIAIPARRRCSAGAVAAG
jgi:PAS domain-containing protein